MTMNFSYKTLSQHDHKKILGSWQRPLTPLEAQKTDQSPLLSSLEGVRALLFDVYGTLIISQVGDIGLLASSPRQHLEPILSQVGIQKKAHSPLEKLLPLRFKEAIQEEHGRLKQQGVDYPEVDVIKMWGSVFSRLHKEGNLEAPPSLLSVAQFAFCYELTVNPIWPMPHALDLLEGLCQGPIVLGIVSNAQFYTPIALELLFGRPLEALGFQRDCCFWSYQEACGKPSLFLFGRAVERLQKLHRIPPAETLFIGNDMLNDIWTASQWGLKTALFAGDRRSLRLRKEDSRCRSLRPDLILTDWCQLSEILL